MRRLSMQFLSCQLKQQKECLAGHIKNKKYLLFLSTKILMFSFYLVMINPVFGTIADSQKQADQRVFVTDQNLAAKKVGLLAQTPMRVLQILCQAFPDAPVEILHQFSFKACHKHLGENDNIRKTSFSSIPGLKEVISIYSSGKLASATAKKNPSWITLNGMMKHLEHKKQIKDPEFKLLSEVLHAPVNTEDWYIYDGGTTDEAINNVAMEFYHSLKSGFKRVWNRLQSKRSSDTLIQTDNALRQQVYEQILTWHNKRADSETAKYIISQNENNSDLTAMQDRESPDSDENDAIGNSYTNSSWSSKSANKAARYFCGALMLSQCISLGASLSTPPYFATSAVNNLDNYCLATDGQCIPVGNANLSRLMTEIPGGNFIAVENINSSLSLLNNTTTDAVVPGEFNGTFSTGNYSLEGFQINGSIPLFESLNNSYIKVNIPLRSAYHGVWSDDPQPVLAKQALHNNRIEATLPDTPIDMGNFYTNPLLRNIEGDYNKITVKYGIKQLHVYKPSYDLYLWQSDTAIITTEVSGNNNHLEQQGRSVIAQSVNNNVLGNTAKIITGTDNKLIYKGVHVYQHTLNSQDIRLTYSDLNTTKSATGRGILQIQKSDQWRNICSQGFSNASSLVACRQIGFDGGGQSELNNQSPSFPVLLNNVSCVGNETTLLQCPHDSVNQYNCTQPLVGLRCRGAKNYNNNIILYSGQISYLPAFIAEAPFAFRDRTAHIILEEASENNSVETTNPTDWRKAHQHMCASEKCDISCHYVHEDFHSVAVSGNKTFLVSRQRYPELIQLPLFLFNESINEARGLIIVTDISQPGANDTIRLYQPPSNNHWLGTLTLDDPAVYTPPVSHVVTNDALLLLHRRPKIFTLKTIKYLDPTSEAPGIQLSELSLNVTNNGTYNSISYNFPGENAVLLSENAAFTHNETTSMIIQHPLEHNGEHYTLGEANATYQLPPEKFITAGYDKDYLYVVTKGQINDQPVNNENLTFSRYDIQSGKRDDSWSASTQPNDLFNEQDDYKLEIIEDEIHMLHREEFNLNDIPHRFWIPQYGECSKIIRTDQQVLPVNITASQRKLQPTPQPTLEPTLEPTSKEDNNTGAIIGGVIGGVAVIAGATGAAVLIAKVCKNKKHNNNDENHSDKENDG